MNIEKIVKCMPDKEYAYFNSISVDMYNAGAGGLEDEFKASQKRMQVEIEELTQNAFNTGRKFERDDKV